jgi:hypothetical protein
VPSKKPSAAKPPDETVFFIDRSLGVDPVRAELINAGLNVEIHDDHFARDEEDRTWLRTVGERGWVVLTKDQRLRYRPLEIAAESQQDQSVRPYGRQSPGHRDRDGLPGCATSDLQSPPFPAWSVRGARLTIGTRYDHLIGIHRNARQDSRLDSLIGRILFVSSSLPGSNPGSLTIRFNTLLTEKGSRVSTLGL